jgi:hypothetical protein
MLGCQEELRHAAFDFFFYKKTNGAIIDIFNIFGLTITPNPTRCLFRNPGKPWLSSVSSI